MAKVFMVNEITKETRTTKETNHNAGKQTIIIVKSLFNHRGECQLEPLCVCVTMHGIKC